MNFSVLLSVYVKEKPSFLKTALYSIFEGQTLKPNEIVLVQDGPLTSELEKVIYDYKNTHPDTLKLVVLENNKGLALALNSGLKECTNELIARMDTDDISTSDRFQKQVSFLNKNKEIDVVGTYISEINENDKIIKEQVKFPLTHKELVVFFKKRDPIAHPTSMFRKSFFEKAGNYKSDLHLAEDTLLWYHGFLNNCKFANIDYVGLKFRRTEDFYKRRADRKKTFQLFKFRVNVINRNLKYGFKANVFAFCYLCMSLSPSLIKKIVYKILR